MSLTSYDKEGNEILMENYEDDKLRNTIKVEILEFNNKKDWVRRLMSYPKEGNPFLFK